MILLDTYTLIGVAAEPGRLSTAARNLIEEPDSRLFVSAITAWEIHVAVQKGRLALNRPPREWLAQAISDYVIDVTAIDWEIASLAAELPKHHADPADRLIVATAVMRNLVLLTPDKNIHKYNQAKVLW
ncbi:MAG TPA: type II toxin-antitoxin system VapC family toxin [Tepidisphaeraceae bacterium]|jgi:PIN domain nuclease of toxin-antitoxin system|nr:type II toxin-antitoxin system VapC family toxin [Tepidisphaeraceae bacterium]